MVSTPQVPADGRSETASDADNIPDGHAMVETQRLDLSPPDIESGCDL
jgi:hypothetical protein